MNEVKIQELMKLKVHGKFFKNKLGKSISFPLQ